MPNEFSRLEDFIGLAKQGKTIQLSVSLRKEKVISTEADKQKDMYLLICDYDFVVDGQKITISKIYESGLSNEPLNATKKHIYIANARLKMDYMRLRDANIPFEELYWEERI